MNSDESTNSKLLQESIDASLEYEYPLPEKTIDDYGEAATSFDGERKRIHLQILSFAVEQSSSIANEIISAEKSKTTWRNVIMGVLLSSLLITLLSLGTLVWFYLFRNTPIPNMLIIGLFGTVIAQIVSLLTLFIKFVNDVKTLKLHEIVTHKLLDYLTKYGHEAEDKNV